MRQAANMILMTRYGGNLVEYCFVNRPAMAAVWGRGEGLYNVGGEQMCEMY
jgi:hypothetical protein